MDRKWWTLIAVCLGTFMLLLDVTIVNVALPAIQSNLKASFSDLQWVVDAYALMLAALLLLTGSLADLFGRRRLFVMGLIVFSISSLLSGLAQSPLWLNLARGAQGIGGAAMFSTSLALLGSSFQGRERGTAFGVWGAITGLAVAIGPVIGGALTTGISWRWIFLVNVPIGVVGVVISISRVEETKQPNARRPDLLGGVLFSGALAALIYALIEGDSSGWTSTKILACLGGALGLLVLWLIAELVQGPRALFDLSLFRKPTFTGGLIAAFALSGGLFALFLYLTLYLQDVLGYSALQTGLRFLVLSGGILLTSTLAGRLTARVPIRLLIAPGLLLCAVGLFLMHGVHASTRWTHLIPGFIVAGAGAGLINPPLASTAIGVVRPDRAGMASGINSTFRQVGIATGIAGLGSIFTHKVRLDIVSLLRGAKGINHHIASALASGVAQGSGAASGMSSVPKAARPTVDHAIRAGFTSGLNEIFLVGAALAVVGAVLTLILIRSKDFEEGSARVVSGPAPQGEPATEAGTQGVDEAEREPVASAPEEPVGAGTSDGTTGAPAERTAASAERPAAETQTRAPGLEIVGARRDRGHADVPVAPTEAAAPAVPVPADGAPARGGEQEHGDVATTRGGEEANGDVATARGGEEAYGDVATARGGEEAAPTPSFERIAAAAERTRRTAYASVGQNGEPDDAGTGGTLPFVGNGSGGVPSTSAVRRAIETAAEAERAALEYARAVGEAREHLSRASEHLDLAGAARQRLNRLADALDDGVAAARIAPDGGNGADRDTAPPSGDAAASTPSATAAAPAAYPGGAASGEVRASRIGADPSPAALTRPEGAAGPAEGDAMANGAPSTGDAVPAVGFAGQGTPPAPMSDDDTPGEAGLNGDEPGTVPSASGFRRF